LLNPFFGLLLLLTKPQLDFPGARYLYPNINSNKE